MDMALFFGIAAYPDRRTTDRHASAGPPPHLRCPRPRPAGLVPLSGRLNMLRGADRVGRTVRDSDMTTEKGDAQELSEKGVAKYQQRRL